jgi:hypothetical protein
MAAYRKRRRVKARVSFSRLAPSRAALRGGPETVRHVCLGSMLSKKASISIVMSLDVLLIIAGSGVRRH